MIPASLISTLLSLSKSVVPPSVLTAISGKVTLLLNGTGNPSGASANRTFVDQSGTGKVVTPTGNVCLTSVSPFSPYGWSARFGGVGNFLTLPYVAALHRWDDSDFTIEAWVYPEDLSTFQYVESGSTHPIMFGRRTATAVYDSWSFGPLADGTLSFHYYVPVGYIQANATSTEKVVTNTWNHVAMTKTAAGITLFVNGVPSSVKPLAGQPIFTDSTTPNLTVGQGNNTAMKGRVSNLRVVKGTALYTGSFTPSKSALAAVSGTSLLLFQDNRFIDKSSAAQALSITGSPSILPVSPFTDVAEYDPLVHGGSAYFDGSGDYLTVEQSGGLTVPNGTWTLEGWVYPAATSWALVCADSGNFYIDASGGTLYIGNGVVNAIMTATPTVNAWTHLAIVNAGGSIKLYFNGVMVATGSSMSINSFTSLVVGYRQAVNQYFKGYVSSLRVTPSALYTSNFGVPTSPPVVVTDTALLLNFYSAGIPDRTTLSPVETSGTAIGLSSLVRKFNPKAIKFNGVDDKLVLAYNPVREMGNKPFTLEMWFNSTTTTQYSTLISNTTAVFATGMFTVMLNTTVGGGDVAVYVGDYSVSTPMLKAGIGLCNGEWHHVALERDTANTWTLLIDGAASASMSSSISVVDKGYVTWVGGDPYYGRYFAGHLDDVRLTIGTMVYPLTLTLPTTEIAYSPEDLYSPYTQVLIKGNGADGSTNNTVLDSASYGFAVSRYGNVSQGPFSPFSPNGWSVEFNQGVKTDYLTVNDAGGANFGTGDLTIEMWLNQDFPQLASLIDYRPLNTNGLYPTLYINAGGYPVWYYSTADRLVSAISVPMGKWAHLAFVRRSGITSIYVNGELGGSFEDASNLSGAAGRPTIGVNAFNLDVTINAFRGRISNLRVVKGTAVYTGPFSPPTQKLTAIAGTTLLTFQDSRLIDNSPSAFTFTVKGTPAAVNVSPFASQAVYDPQVHGGSYYLDGAGDYLQLGYPLNLGTVGPFTLEFWIYPIALPYATSALFALGGTGFTGFYVYGPTSTGITHPFALGVGIIGTNEIRSIDNVVALKQWQHVAYTYDGITNTNIFLNGLKVGSGTLPVYPNNSGSPMVGNWPAANQYFNGYMSNVRFNKGVLYTSSFTPSTTPLTVINANTQFLLLGSNAKVYDTVGHMTIETAGNARLSTSKFKFGASSLYFDGTAGTYLRLAPGALNFSASDFSIEFWLYKTVQSPAYGMLFSTGHMASLFSGIYMEDNAGTLLLFISSAGSSFDIAGGSAGLAAGVLPVGAWTHVVLRRTGSSFNVFINGALTATFSSSLPINCLLNQMPVIGGISDVNRTITGYVDDFRVLIGKSAYTVEPKKALTL